MPDANDSDPSSLTDDQFLAWGGSANGFANDLVAQNNANYSGWTAPQGPNSVQTSNQLIRRNQNNQLATGTQPHGNINGDQQGTSDGLLDGAWNGDNGLLKEKADRAKQEALSRRPPRQIPPFIQKLSSFLDNNRNVNLIRWSSTGASFVVLDEDAFANELIPELFKHRNYTSFVRQLNMYGFHKKVGLTDNSMRASERKSKSPSEYEHAFFKKARPELLWLIAKPTSGKRKRGTKDHSDGEDSDEMPEYNPAAANKKLDLVTLPRSQLATFQSEIQGIQRQQQHINQMIARFQHENTQYIRQASERHERHENSINAILQFLATFYSRNADNSGNIPNMFGGNLPNNQPSGNVQEMNEYDDGEDQQGGHARQPQQRRPLALLPAPEVLHQVRSVTPEAAASRPVSSQEPQQQTTSQRPSHAYLNAANHPAGQAKSPLVNRVDYNEQSPNMTAASTPEAITPLPGPLDAQSASQPRSQDQPHPLRQSQASDQPQLQSSNSEIMRLINNSNAASTDFNNLDFTSALKNYENASPNGPLTPEQRNSVLSLMANSSEAPSPMSSALFTNAALGAGPQDLSQYAANQDQLGLLQKLQREQDSRVQSLADRLQPLSPHGSIPGLEDMNAQGLQGIENFNLNAVDTSRRQNEEQNIENWLHNDYIDDGAGNNGSLNLGDDFTFDDANQDYFGNINAGGSNSQYVPVAEDAPGVKLSPTTGDDDLFGLLENADDKYDKGDSLLPDSLEPTVGEEQNSSEGGKVIGSVGTSSAGRSPNMEAVKDEEEGGRRKRQRIG